MRRRTLLTALGTGAVPLAGCTATSELVEREDLPTGCPTSQDLGVEWPSDLDDSAVEAFVKEYELTYYQQEVFDDLFEPQSRLDTYEGWIGRVPEVAETDDGGWRAQFEGIVNVRRGDLVFVAAPADPPGDPDVIPIREIEDENLKELLDNAAATGRTSQRIAPTQTDGYLDLFERLADEFELTHIEDSHTLYFDRNGTTIELVVSWSPPNRDHFWYVSYYVDEHVVWRSAEEAADPREGELLECRTSS